MSEAAKKQEGASADVLCSTNGALRRSPTRESDLDPEALASGHGGLGKKGKEDDEWPSATACSRVSARDVTARSGPPKQTGALPV